MTRQRRISRLKTTLLNATRFEEAMNQFLDLVEVDPGVVTEATPCTPGLLVRAIELAARSAADTDPGAPRRSSGAAPGARGARPRGSKDLLGRTADLPATRDPALEDELLTVSLLSVPGHKLVHGTVLLGRRLATVIWFDDAQVGLLALVMSRRETRFTRFRLERAPTGGAPGRN